MTKVLVVGSNSQIGKILIEQLKQSNYEVTSLSVFSEGDPIAIATGYLAIVENAHFPDYIIFLSWNRNRSIQGQYEAYRIFSMFSQATLKFSSKLLFISTLMFL